MRNKADDLINHLFATMEGLLDEEKPLEISRAKAVADCAQVIVNAAKVEVDYLNKLNKGDLPNNHKQPFILTSQNV